MRMDAEVGVTEAKRTMAEGCWPLSEAGIVEGLGRVRGDHFSPQRNEVIRSL